MKRDGATGMRGQMSVPGEMSVRGERLADEMSVRSGMRLRSRVIRGAVVLAVMAGSAGCGDPDGVPRLPGERAPFEAAADGSTSATPAETVARTDTSVASGDTSTFSALASDTAGAANEADGLRVARDTAARRAVADTSAAARLPDGSPRPRFERPEAIRGIYLNAWAAGSRNRRAALIDLARRTEINTFVIDIKDASGYVSHDSQVPMAREVGALGERRISDLVGLLRELEAEGIWPIARIVIVKDPLLVKARPELAVQDTAGGVWVDSKEIVWMNAYDRRVWEYNVDLAEEVARLGFPEIQWDYVRFPDAPASDMARARFPGDSLGSRSEAIRALLGYARNELDALGLGVSSTADVFGVTTSYTRDVGIGQLWESFIDRVDAALPMVYPSHYWRGSYGWEAPNARPYEIVRKAMEDAVERSAEVDGAGRVIPWLQDFTLGAPAYDGPEVRAQIQGSYDAGVDEWILWNPGSRYTEEALQPVGGWETEPRIRVAGEIVPVSERFEAIERERGAQMPPDTTVADSITGGG